MAYRIRIGQRIPKEIQFVFQTGPRLCVSSGLPKKSGTRTRQIGRSSSFSTTTIGWKRWRLGVGHTVRNKKNSVNEMSLMKLCELCRFTAKTNLVVAVVLFAITGCSERQPQQVRASDLMHKYIQIANTRELTDENIREAIFKIVPPGSSVSEVFERMASTGLGAGHCAPGEDDGSLFSGMPYCGIRSSEETCGNEYVNYNIHFVAEKKPGMNDLFEPGATKLLDIKVNRWTRECKK